MTRHVTFIDNETEMQSLPPREVDELEEDEVESHRDFKQNVNSLARDIDIYRQEKQNLMTQ